MRKAVGIAMVLGAACGTPEKPPTGVRATTQAAAGPREVLGLPGATTTTVRGFVVGEAAGTTTTLVPVRVIESATTIPRARVTVAPHPASPPRSTSSELAAIRKCESGGDYSAVSPSGQYRGAYQFDASTWAAAGGSGDPASASPAEQDARAQAWIDKGHRGAWPNC